MFYKSSLPPFLPLSLIQLLMMVAGLLCVVSAQAASFDCAKAGTKVEKLICADETLSKLDEELSSAYKAAVKDEKQAEAIKQSQKQWMKERNECENIACAKASYQARIHVLNVLSVQDAKLNKYKVIRGKEYAICDKILSRMNEEVKLNKPVCGINLLKSIPGVALPEWTRLSLKENKLLYMRFLLANKVLEKNYTQAFGQQHATAGKTVKNIHIPPVELTLFGEHISIEQLEQMWGDAVENGYEFYRWDGVFLEPEQTDVLLIETGIDVLQGGCPKIRMVRFASDLLTPKPLMATKANWLLGPEAIPFKYENQIYRLENEEGHTMDQEAQVRVVPSRSLTVGAIRNSHYCLIQSSVPYKSE